MKRESLRTRNVIVVIVFLLIWVFTFCICDTNFVRAGTQDLPNITVTGVVYQPDGENYASHVTVEIASGADDELFSPRIFYDTDFTEQNTFSASGDFEVYLNDAYLDSYYNHDQYGYAERASSYEPGDHFYLVINKDTNKLQEDVNGSNVLQQRPARVDLGAITSDTVIDVGNLYFREPNVFGTVASAVGVSVSRARVVLTKSGEQPTWDDQMVTVTSSGYDGQFWFYRELGTYTLRVYTGGEPVVGYPGQTTLDELVRTIEIVVGDEGINLGEVYTDDDLSSYESFRSNTEEVPVEAPPVDSLIANVNQMALSKDTVGLNSHLSLQGGAYDNRYLTKLEESGTKWVREHIASEVDITTSDNWSTRYTQVRNYYRSRDISIVALLAYNFDSDNRYVQPDLDRWSAYVEDVVALHKDYIKVWEIWNEPDLSKYLNPNTVANYVPILRTAYRAIKSVDPDALVLSAPPSSPNPSFMEGLYQQAGDYFDEPAMHVYHCDQYKQDGNLGALQRDFASTLAVINQYRPADNIWITELGCSTYDGYSEEFQRDYFQVVVPYLLSTNRVEKIFLYTMFNRDIGDPYEDSFGLLHLNATAKPAWNWYVAIGGGGSAGTVANGTFFFAYDSTLRGGYQISGGNVLGDSQDEIITGTGDGLGPHVQVFDNHGNKKAQFFAYDSSLRNGVSVSACDVNHDGYDEIVTAQGRGGWPVVKVFDGYGQVINEGFYVLDGKFLGGVNLSCGDTDGDGTQEIVVAARQGGGPHVLVYNLNGRIMTNFMAYDPGFRGGINVGTIDMDGNGRDEIVTGPQVGAPHVQIFQIRPNELKRLSPGFFAFNLDYRGGVDVGGVDTDGDGTKELIVSVGDNATPFVKVYNIREEIQKEFYAYGTNFLGGVNLGGGDVDGDGADELLVIPRGGGGPQVKIINVDEI